MKRIKYVIKFLKIVFWNEGILKKTFSKLLAIITLLSIVLVFYIEWIYWLLIFLFLLWVQTIYWAYLKWRGEVGNNWIESYEIENGKLPVLPDYLLEIATNYTVGTPIHKDITIIPCQMQSWSKFKRQPNRMRKLLELLKWLGEEPEEYIAKVEGLAPPDGRNKGLNYKR